MQSLTASRLRELRKGKGLSQEQVAKMIGISRPAYVNYEAGKSRPIRKIDELAKLFDVSTDYLLGAIPVHQAFSTQRVVTDGEKGVKIPVFGAIACGIPIEAIDDIVDYEEIPAAMLRGGREYFALQAKGDSMEPRISDGDIVIIEKRPEVESGQIAAVMVGMDEATIKKVMYRKDGMMLVALNAAAYEPHFYTVKEAAELPVRVIGRVVERRTKF